MTLLCPRTGTAMEEVTINGVELNISPACGGIWFDNWELEKFDEVHETAGDELLELVEKYSKPGVDLPEQRLKSPRAEGVVMMRRFFGTKRKVEIDECPATGGIWLDAGELAAIRSTYPTEAERKAAAGAFVSEMLASKEFQDTLDATKQRRVTNVFRRMLGLF